jgi:hypothetical protein
MAGVNVSWHMTPEQVEKCVALLAAHGPRRLAEVALEMVTARGAPTFARAWIEEWRRRLDGWRPEDLGGVDVPAPREAPWCRQCDAATYRWEIEDDGRPIRPCPRCHPMSTQPAPF